MTTVPGAASDAGATNTPNPNPDAPEGVQAVREALSGELATTPDGPSEKDRARAICEAAERAVAHAGGGRWRDAESAFFHSWASAARGAFDDAVESEHRRLAWDRAERAEEALAAALDLLDRYGRDHMGGTPDLFAPYCGHVTRGNDHDPWECMEDQVASVRAAVRALREGE